MANYTLPHIFPHEQIDDRLPASREIIDRAIAEYKPYAIVMMFSGGHDSLAAYHAARALDVPLTHFLHGITGTGISETTDFARRIGEQSGLRYLEANAGNAYEEYVLRKGFFGVGSQAHEYAYHILKHQRFRHQIAEYIRQRQKSRNVLLINGGRKQESTNRKLSMITPIKAQGPNVWVNIINDWSALERNEFIADYERNPVYDILHRSAECLCGSMQSQETRKEVSYWFPSWGKWLDGLEREACSRGFCWRWGEDLPDNIKAQKKFSKELNGGQAFMPMCQSCLLGDGITKRAGAPTPNPLLTIVNL